MKIEGTPKEIADLIVALQDRQIEFDPHLKKMPTYSGCANSPPLPGFEDLPCFPKGHNFATGHKNLMTRS